MSERAIREGESYEISPKEAAKAEAAIEQAERDIEEMRAAGRWGPSEGSIPVEGKVTMRWPRAQLDVVRKAAALFGMPYQSYVKQAAFRAALDDLQKVQTVTGQEKKGEAA